MQAWNWEYGNNKHKITTKSWIIDRHEKKEQTCTCTCTATKYLLYVPEIVNKSGMCSQHGNEIMNTSMRLQQNHDWLIVGWFGWWWKCKQIMNMLFIVKKKMLIKTSTDIPKMTWNTLILFAYHQSTTFCIKTHVP